MKTWFLSVSLLVATGLSGCAARPIHPGAANRADSDFYDTLLVTNSVIENTKADLDSGKFPASIRAKVISSLNTLVTLYNDADKVYVVYHNAALAGTATTQQQTDVQTKINSVTNAVSALASAKGGM